MIWIGLALSLTVTGTLAAVVARLKRRATEWRADLHPGGRS
jgi:hypothetical protein